MPSNLPTRSSSVALAFSRWTLNSQRSGEAPPPSYEEPQASQVIEGSSTSTEPTRPQSENASSPPELPRAPSPVVLAWNPERDSDLNDFPAADAPIPGSSNAQPIGEPPSYVVAQRPTKPIKYTFSPIGYNSMILLPPSTAQDTRPQYHMSVQLDCFNPLSSTTVIRRGANENGDLVGEFQMGIGNSSPTLFIRNEEFRIDRVFLRMGSRHTGIWRWTFKKKYLVWNCERFPRYCFSSQDQNAVLYAKFTYPTDLRKRNMPAELSQLEVFPAGQEFFDDILMSILIIERWRLLPAHGDFKALFGR